VGTLSHDLRIGLRALGDTVNLASRMEGLAEPGTTYVTAETFALAEGFFRFEALGEKHVKGKQSPVKVYQVIAPSSQRTRFDVSAERGLTPWVGRRSELKLLLKGLWSSQKGQSQVFSIIAEAGGGKSRLLYEFRKAVASHEVTFLEGKCLSYSRGVAYHPIIDLLKSGFEIQEEDGDAEVRKKIIKGLNYLKADLTHTLPYLLELLSVKDSGIDNIRLSPEAKKAQIIKAVKEMVISGSEIHPLVIAIEDLHWIDKSSEELLRHLVEGILETRILPIFTYRPNYSPSWLDQPFHNQLRLQRLTDQEGLELAAHLLGTREFERPLEALLLEKTEGNPFFLEEFIRSLKDLKLLEKKGYGYGLSEDTTGVIVPSTIQEVILARVDPQPHRAKAVLQAGSVIEREFDFQLIQRVTRMPEAELLGHLALLKDAELLYERGVYPQSRYVFKHALTREVVYGSILTKRRKEIHVAVASALEELYSANPAEHLGALCHHFMAGENYAKGEVYAGRAAQKALKSGSLQEAIDQTRKRITCLERLPQTEDRLRKIIDTRAVLGLNLAQLNRYFEAKEAVDPIIDLAVATDYRKRLCQIKTTLGAYYAHQEENFPAASEAFKTALALSEEMNDTVSTFLSSYWFGSNLCLNCEFRQGAGYLKKALEISIAAGNPRGIASTKASFAYFSHFNQGMIDTGFRTSIEAVQIAQESRDDYSKGIAHTCHGVLCFARRLFEDALEHLTAGIGFCEKVNEKGWNFLAHWCLGEIYLERDDPGRAEEWYKRGCRLLQDSLLFPSLICWGEAGMLHARSTLRPEKTDRSALYALCGKNQYKAAQGWIFSRIGTTLMNLGQEFATEAAPWIERAIEEDLKNGTRFFLARDYLSYGKLFRRAGDRARARVCFETAIDIMRECGADGWMEKLQQEKAAL
jgi:tetratricopeptide (TPR) repeat protein